MHHSYSPVRFTALPCAHCAAWTTWPRWARVSPNRYQALCWPCYDALDQDFTIAAVLDQARVIVRAAVAR